MPIVHIHQLGQMPYPEAWELQTRLQQEVIGQKLARREAQRTDARRSEGLRPMDAAESSSHHLLFVEHPPVYTLGKSGSIDHLLLSENELANQGFTFHKINRGGDITYHGPGQLVAYPIFDLDEFFNDVHRYVRSLEEVIIRTMADFGLQGERDSGFTGVWLAGDSTRRQPRRKICAIGVHLSRWTTMHGLAFNVRPNLTHFNNIVPCGIAQDDRAVTSLSVELGRPVELHEVQPVMERHFAEVFAFTPTKAAPPGILRP